MAPDRKALVKLEITPRFELFYALQALESGVGEHFEGWRRDMDRGLPDRVRTSLASVAPSPIMWPLLADSLRDEPAGIGFAEMIAALRAMSDGAFQRSVLGGVFKAPGSVDGLISGTLKLRHAVAAESREQERLLSLVGLYPFSRNSASALAVERIRSAPANYRGEAVSVIQSFWSAGFSATWAVLEPQMRRSARAMKDTIARDGLAELARERKLPITQQKDGTIVSASGSTKIPLASILGVHLIPSVFNTGKLWAAYASSRGTRFYIPVLDPAISLTPKAITAASEKAPEPALIFRALGDTTRYAIASTIARTPMTSVELARIFDVSKPTISHHVQQLRAAGLLVESPTDNGVVLSVNRRGLERASAAAAREMFSEDGPAQVIRRTRKANRE